MNVAFEAHHAERNHHRRYEITIGRDLLDDWTVSIRYGRTGSGGHVLRYAGQDTAKLQAIVKERLRRRLSAPKRIGCSYQLKQLNAASGFESDEWLPGEVMRHFFLVGTWNKSDCTGRFEQENDTEEPEKRSQNPSLKGFPAHSGH